MAEQLFLDINTLLKAPPNIQGVLQQTQAALNRQGINIKTRLSPRDLRNLELAINKTQAGFRRLGQGPTEDFVQASNTIRSYQQSLRGAATLSEELGKQTAITVKRFTGYVIATRTLLDLTGALGNAVRGTLELSRELTRISQLTNTNRNELGGLRKEINDLSSEFGLSALEIADAGKILAQAGKSVSEIRTILSQSAPATLTATIGDYSDSLQSVLAIQSQFRLQASQTAEIFDILNAVTKSYNVSIDEFFEGVKRSGSAYATLSGVLEQGRIPEENLQSFREYVALFTSIISTSRESAATVGTSLKTIFPRLQREEVRRNVSRTLGIELEAPSGEALAPFEQIRRISEALKSISAQDFRFADVVERIGGQRQFARTVALLTEFEKASQALSIAETSRGSVTEDVIKAQEDFLVQIQKVRAEFQKFIDELSQTGTIERLAKILLELARSAITVARAVEPLLPILTVVLGLRGLQGLSGFSRKFVSNLPPAPPFIRANSGGRIKLAGGGIPVALTPGEIVVPPDEARRIGYNQLNIANKTGNLSNLNLQNYRTVPGTGNTDSFFTRIPANSFVLRKSVSQNYLKNRFALGGRVGLQDGGITPQRPILSAEQISIAINEMRELGASSKTISNVFLSLNESVRTTDAALDFLAKNIEQIRSSRGFNRELLGGGTQSGSVVNLPEGRTIDDVSLQNTLSRFQDELKKANIPISEYRNKINDLISTTTRLRDLEIALAKLLNEDYRLRSQAVQQLRTQQAQSSQVGGPLIPFAFSVSTQARTPGDVQNLSKQAAKEFFDNLSAQFVSGLTTVETVSVTGNPQLALPPGFTPQLLADQRRLPPNFQNLGPSPSLPTVIASQVPPRNFPLVPFDPQFALNQKFLSGDVAGFVQGNNPLLQDRILQKQQELQIRASKLGKDLSESTLRLGAIRSVVGSIDAEDANLVELSPRSLERFKDVIGQQALNRSAQRRGGGFGRAVSGFGNLISNPAFVGATALISSQLAQSESRNAQRAGGVLNSALIAGATGFSVGGPQGAAIGAVVGGLVGLASAINDYAEEIRSVKLDDMRKQVEETGSSLEGFVKSFDESIAFANITGEKLISLNKALDIFVNNAPIVRGASFIGDITGFNDRVLDRFFTLSGARGNTAENRSLDQALGRAGLLDRGIAFATDIFQGGLGREDSSVLQTARRQAEREIGGGRDRLRSFFDDFVLRAQTRLGNAGADNIDREIANVRNLGSEEAKLLALFNQNLKSVDQLDNFATTQRLAQEVLDKTVISSARELLELNNRIQSVNITIQDWGRSLDLSLGQLNRIADSFQNVQGNLSQIDSQIGGNRSFRASQDRNVFSDITGVGQQEFFQALRNLEGRLGGNVGQRFNLVADLATGAQFLQNTLRERVLLGSTTDSTPASVALQEAIPSFFNQDIQDVLRTQIENAFTGDRATDTIGQLRTDPARIDEIFGDLVGGPLEKALNVLAKTSDATAERIGFMEETINSLNQQILSVQVGGLRDLAEIGDRFGDLRRSIRGDDGANLTVARFRAERNFRLTSGGLDLRDSIQQLGFLNQQGQLSPTQTLQQNRLIEALKLAAGETNTLAEIQKRANEIEQNKVSARSLTELVATATPEERININRQLSDFNFLQRGGVLTGERLSNALRVGETALRGQGIRERDVRNILDEFLFRGAERVLGPGEDPALRRIERNLFPEEQLNRLDQLGAEEFERIAQAQRAVLESQLSALDAKINFVNQEIGLITSQTGGILQQQLRSVFQEAAQSEFAQGLSRFADVAQNSQFQLEIAPTTVNLNISAPDLAQLANSDAFAEQIQGAVQTFIENNASKIANIIANV